MGSLSVDTIKENTNNTGVTIESVLLKDDTVDASIIKASNFKVGSRTVFDASAGAMGVVA